MSDPQGLVFDPVAETYERGRTPWPEGVVEGVGGRDALDLAAGTGKLTRLLVPRFQRVVAVEPLEAMRAVGAAVVPDAEWLAGTAEAIPLPDASVDAAFVAEAFHWFDSGLAVAELARVLRPAGTLVLAFTVWDEDFDPRLPEEAEDAIRTASRKTGRTGAPKIESGEWRRGFEGSPFTELEQRDVPFVHVTDRAGVIAYYLSMSTIAARPQPERDELEAVLKATVSETTYRVGITARTYRTERLR